VGSEEQVSINQMISIIEDIAEYKIKKNFQLDKPKGVRGRSSDNTLIENKINWRPGYNLRQGLKETYKWIYDELKSGSNIQKFTRK
jgi:nucleoside-diphosphate-sugar epimerase